MTNVKIKKKLKKQSSNIFSEDSSWVIKKKDI